MTDDVITLHCLKCDAEYTCKKRRASHFCQPCRIDIDNLQRARRHATSKARRDDMLAELDEYARRGMSDDYIADATERVDLYLAEVDERDVPTGHDVMPAGANSPAGPDEGTSSYFADLRDDLDTHAAEVARHPWFDAHPHWSYRLHDDDAHTYNLNAA